MASQPPGQGRANGEDGNEHQAAERSGADASAAAPAPAGGDAPSSNTASHSYIGDGEIKVLRIGVDSLYVSYYGEIDPVVEVDLEGKKLLAQSRKKEHQALAQWEVQGHIFEVSDRGQSVKGQGGFAYVLEDKAFRIAISSSRSRALPLAYVKISSEYLAHSGPEAAIDQLSAVIDTFGTAERYPIISRVDLYADFQAGIEMEGFPRHAWVCRSGSVNTYSVKGEFSGYTIGQGASISCRLYNKSLEIRSSRKAYFLPLWQRAGMDSKLPVWRLEFQIDRQVLHQLGVRSFDGFMRELGGIWGYATQTWLRLAVPQAEDSKTGPGGRLIRCGRGWQASCGALRTYL